MQAGPTSLLALSRAADLDKTTTHRLATSLTRYGLLRFDPVNRSHSLGLRLVELGHRAIAQLDLEAEARPFLQPLGASSGEAVHLGVFDEGEVVYVAQLPTQHPVIIRARVERVFSATVLRCVRCCSPLGQPTVLKRPWRDSAGCQP